MTEPKQLKAKDVSKLRAFLLRTQKGKCPICRKVITDACLDHSHVKRIKGTGLIRGVLCRTCNVFIAKSENNCTRYGIEQIRLPTILRACARYLERKHLPYIHPSEKPKRKILTKSSYNSLKKSYTKTAKFPEYKIRKGKRGQILTKPLEKLFQEYNITPEFYK
jgi:hypothetical protein